MIRSLSESVIIPIAGLIITFVLCYELISMIVDKNNLHDVDTWMFFKYFFKMWVAVFLVTHTFDITMAVFDLGQHIVARAASSISGSTSIDIASALAHMRAGLDAMGIPELLFVVVETSIVQICMTVLSVIITVILYGRMIEIYLYCSVAPVPIATLSNREWGQVGNNYLRGAFGARLPRLFYHGVRGYLCRAGAGHHRNNRHPRKHIRHSGLYRHPVHQPVQDKRPVQVHFQRALRRCNP
jgi:hypothetical protein